MGLNKRNKVLLFVLAIAMILISHIYTLFYFPPSEGWWQVYAYLYAKGFGLYEDMNVAFPPLFILYNAAIMRLSKYYMFYRALGVVQVIGIFVFMYLCVRKYYDERVSLFAALFSALMSIYNVVYFPNDYHTAVSLFVILSIYFLLEYHDYSRSDIRRLLSLMLASFFIAGTFYLKQNIGFVLAFSVLCGFLISFWLSGEMREFYVSIYLVLFLLLFGSAYAYFLKMDMYDLFSLTAKNDSKGNVVTVVTRILLDEYNREYLIKGLFYFPGFLFYLNIKEKARLYYPKMAHVLEICVFIFLAIIFFRDPERSSVLMVVVFVYMLIYEFVINKKYDLLALPLIAIVYANSMTAGLCVGGTFLVMPFAIAYIFDRLVGDNERLDFEYLSYPFLLVLFVSLFIYKNQMPYNWWGLRQGAVSQAKYVLPYEELKYFSVDKATYELFSDIKNEIDAKSEKNNDVYLYPDIPIFYQLHGKIPPTSNIVQWYDVISTEQMKKELVDVDSARPNIVIMLDTPWEVYKGHAALKQSRLKQVDFIKYMNDQVAIGSYKLVKYKIYDDELYGDNVNDEGLVKMQLVVRAPGVVGKTIEQLYDNGVLMDNYDVYDLISRSIHVKDIKTHKLMLGDKICVSLKYSQISDLVCKIGEPDFSDNKKYVLKIYELVGL